MLTDNPIILISLHYIHNYVFLYLKKVRYQMYTIKYFIIICCLGGLLSSCSTDSEQTNKEKINSVPDNQTFEMPGTDTVKTIATSINMAAADSSEVAATIIEDSKKIIKERSAKETTAREKPRAQQKEKDQKRTEKGSRSKPVIAFKEMVHNYGNIDQGEKVNHKFVFTNMGSKELVISGAKATCGCTQPSFPFLPIAPGEEGFIGVVFDSKGKLGRQKPKITVTTNASPPTYELFLEGFVNTPENEKEVKEEKTNN